MVVLAHAGAGATWQALLVLCAFGLVGIFIGVVAGRIRLDEPGDLVLPFAATAVLASLSGATNSVLSDWVGWWAPIGGVALVAILLATFTPLELTPRSPLTIGSVVVALVAAFLLHGTLEDAWHPPDGGLERDDVTIQIVEPSDGYTVPIGPTTLTVQVEGGTIGPGPTTTRPDDPEELGVVHVFVDGIMVTNDDGRPLRQNEDCTDGCTEATWDIELERGPHVVSVEFLTASVESFATTAAGSPTVDLVTIAAE